MNSSPLSVGALEQRAEEVLRSVNYPFELLEAEVRGGAAWAKRAPRILLTLAGIPPQSSLADAKPWTAKENLLPNKKWIERYNAWWGSDVSRGTYDYFLRNGLRPLIDIGLVLEDPDVPGLRKPNSPSKCYGLSPAAAQLLHDFLVTKESAVLIFLAEAAMQRAAYVKVREANTLNIDLGGGKAVKVAKDDHNSLQKAILESFLPHFVPKFELVYVGETSNREIVRNEALIQKLDLGVLFNDKLPDVVAYDWARDWIILVEAYHSSGAIDTRRHDRFKCLLGNNAGKAVFVTAFANRNAYKAHVSEIAWKTEVWIADEWDHLIHMDGERFLGPYV